jgi:hypothetical protein
MPDGRIGTRLRAGLAVCVAAAMCALPASAAQAATLPAVTIAVTPSSATVSGALESGAANIVTKGTGTKEAAVIVFLLKPGVTIAEAEAFARSDKHPGDPNYAEKYGSIVFDNEATAKGAEAQTLLVPGTYVVLVSEGENGKAQIRTHFTVTAAKAPAALPKPEATIRSIEFGFRGPSSLHDGELVAFENEGFLVHMDVAFPVRNMAAARKAVGLLKAGNEKAVGKLVVGAPVTFTGPVSHEALQEETITVKPGVYVQVCFMQTQDGRDHATLGMERIIKISK